MAVWTKGYKKNSNKQKHIRHKANTQMLTMKVEKIGV